MNELVHENPVVWGDYAAEVQNVRRYISERLLWMDEKIGYTYEPDGIENVSLDINQPCRIFNLSGLPYNGDVRHLPQGIYIVRQGSKTKKVQAK
jgi:hypothetical protein